MPPIDTLNISLLVLVPGAQFSLWQNTPPAAITNDPTVTVSVINGITVLWSNSNTSSCPTSSAVSAVTPAQISAYVP